MKSTFSNSYDYNGTVVFSATIDPADIVVVDEIVQHAEHPVNNYRNYCKGDATCRFILGLSEELRQRLEDFGIIHTIERFEIACDLFDYRVMVDFYKMRSFERKCEKVDKANAKLDAWCMSENKMEYVENYKKKFAEDIENRIRGSVKHKANNIATQMLQDDGLNTSVTNLLKSEYDAAKEAYEKAQKRIVEAKKAWKNARHKDRLAVLERLAVDKNVQSIVEHSLNNAAIYNY